jgi:hypothetical protein
MPKPVSSLTSSRRRAALVGAAALLGAGCVETVSLGSGVGETEAEDPALPIHPWRPSERRTWDIDPGAMTCKPTLVTDLDGDGFTREQGDCDDCDPDVGPNAVEMPTIAGAPRDENCDGVVDEPQPACDAALPVDAVSPLAAARAIDICFEARKDRWGVERAAWVLPDGATEPSMRSFALGHGILDRFGPNVPVRYGARLLALSTGTARQPADDEYESPRGHDKGFTCGAPAGFSQPSPGCSTVIPGQPHDGVALELTLRAPQNAEAFAFDFNFYTYELPGPACTTSNDLFIALLEPPPSGRPDGNIAFDAQGNLVSVNTVLLDVCQCDAQGGPPCKLGGRWHGCSIGAKELLGTGFGKDVNNDVDRGATGWLTSTAEIERGGTVRLRFSLHDAADGYADSTVLVDHFRWLRREPVVARSHHSE